MIVNKQYIYLGSISTLCSCMLQSATVAQSASVTMSSATQTEQLSTTQTTGKSILEKIQALNQSLTGQTNTSSQHTTAEIASGNTKEKLTLFEQLTGIQNQLAKVTPSSSDTVQKELAASFEQFKSVCSQLLQRPDTNTCQQVINAINKQFAELVFSATESTNNTSNATLSATTQPTITQSDTGHTRGKSILDENEDAAHLAQAMGVVHQETASQSSESAPSDSSQPATTTSVSASESTLSSSSSATLASTQEQTIAPLSAEQSDSDIDSDSDTDDHADGESRAEVRDIELDRLTRGKLPESILEWIANPKFEIAQFAHLQATELVSEKAKQFCKEHKEEIHEIFQKVREKNTKHMQQEQENICAHIAYALFHRGNAAKDPEMSRLSLQDLYNGVVLTCIPERNALRMSEGDRRPCPVSTSKQATPDSLRITNDQTLRQLSDQQQAEAVRAKVKRPARTYDPNLLSDDTPKPVKRTTRWERFKKLRNFCSKPWVILGGIGLAGIIVYLIVRAKYPTEIII